MYFPSTTQRLAVVSCHSPSGSFGGIPLRRLLGHIRTLGYCAAGRRQSDRGSRDREFDQIFALPTRNCRSRRSLRSNYGNQGWHDQGEDTTPHAKTAVAHDILPGGPFGTSSFDRAAKAQSHLDCIEEVKLFEVAGHCEKDVVALRSTCRAFQYGTTPRGGTMLLRKCVYGRDAKTRVALQPGHDGWKRFALQSRGGRHLKLRQCGEGIGFPDVDEFHHRHLALRGEADGQRSLRGRDEADHASATA